MSANPTIKALRSLLRDESLTEEQMDRHVKELTGRNDRLIAIVSGVAVESALTGKLKAAMRHSASTDELFKPNNPLSTFSAKINIAYALSLIDSDTRRNADYIREIRNVFAHRLIPTSLHTPEIHAAINLLMVGPYGEKWSGVNASARRRLLAAKMATISAIWGKQRLADYGVAKPLSLPQKRS